MPALHPKGVVRLRDTLGSRGSFAGAADGRCGLPASLPKRPSAECCRDGEWDRHVAAACDAGVRLGPPRKSGSRARHRSSLPSLLRLLVPRAGRVRRQAAQRSAVSGAALVGIAAIARSVRAVMVRLGFAPMLAGTAEPSHTNRF